MADVLAIVSKAVFEKAAGKHPAVGARLAMDRYVSANKNLAPLAAGGRLYLVTVRPPDEQLWLIAILDHPASDGTQWVAAPSAVAITDITALRAQLTFESGAGITAKPGALGMSLQTPRVLTAADAALLDAAAGGGAGEGAEGAEGGAGSGRSGADDRRAQLLRGVIADPDSVAARQVYADELMQAGDPRGELIQLELALAGPLGIRTRAQLAHRHAELVAAHARAWFPYKITSYRTRGGFLASVRATFGQLRASAAMFAAEPIVEVEVTELDAASARQLATAPWLARLRRLILRSPLGNAAFAALWRSRGAAHLRALNVTAGGLGAAALAGAGDGMPHLETLVLSANPIGDAGLAALGAWNHRGALDTLYLSGCRITPAGLDALLAGGGLARLDKLCISKNQLGDAIGAVIAGHAARLPALRHLELASTGATASAVATIVAARLPKLAILDVRKNNLARQGVAGLAPYVRA